MRPVPSAVVLRWLAAQPSSSLFTTTITEAEILYGLELLPRGKRRLALQSAVDAMFEGDFSDRILPFDSDAARI
jgi:predicted nucleic acid-binding protein